MRVLVCVALVALALLSCCALPQPALALPLRSARHPSPADPVAQALQRSTARPFASKHTGNEKYSEPARTQRLPSLKKKKGAAHAAHSAAASDRQTDPLVFVHQTTSVNDDRLARLPPLKVRERAAASAGGDNTPLLHIDPSEVYQSIVGFGGAITESTVHVLSQLPAEATQTVIDAYFGEDGNRYSLARLHINSCDFSLNSWNFDNVTDDFSLRHFDRKLTHMQSQLLPFIKQALAEAYHPLALYASPWSPPAWMKTNNDMNSSAVPGLKPEPKYQQAWADYLSLWFTSMEEQGVPFWGMTVQNEPEFAAPWEACVYTAASQRDFIKNHLGPTLRREHPELRIIIYDHNKDHVKQWADTIYSDAEAAKFVWGAGVHWYSGDQFDRVQATHDAWPSKGLLATEATNEAARTGPLPGSVLHAERYAHDILGDLNAWVQGWTDWNLVLDERGGPNHLNNWCDAPVIANVTDGTLAFQPMYFYMGHFARFLPPGAQRIKHDMDNWQQVGGLEYATFLVQRETSEQRREREGSSLRQPASASSKGHEGGHGHTAAPRRVYSASHPSPAGADVVLIVMNAHDSAAEFDLALGQGRAATVMLPPHSIQTVVFDQQLLD